MSIFTRSTSRLGAALLSIMLTGVVPAYASSPDIRAATTASDAPQTEEQAALQQAATSGERVEVTGQRTERETTFANPDGETFTLEKSITPVRVEKPGGGWAVPDATLVKRDDGSVGPKAAVAGVTFSAGGDGKDLVKISEDGRSVSLGWPGTLPAPKLDGTRATYENVLPDVNLIMTATVEGFHQVLEVRTEEAAANPALQRIDYALDADGLKIRDGAGGGAEAVDGNGQVVFRSPAARMWNSAGDVAQESADGGSAAQTAGLARIGAADPEPGATVDVAPGEEGDPLTGPGAGDESAVLDLALGSSSVTVRPDSELLSKAGPATLPYYIDPSIELNEDERTVLSSDGDVFYNFSGGDNGMSVGKCGSAVIGGVTYTCGNGYVNRMYFEFSPSKLKGKEVLDASFNVTETWSFSCDARWIDLERTDNISASSKWPGPKKLDQMVDRNVSAGRGSACSPSQPRSAIEFHDYAPEPDENLTPTVKAFADGKMSRLTLMLMAKSESDTISWKRFDDDAVLKVTYIGKPALPGDIGIAAGSGRVCSTDSSKPSIVSSPQPTLQARPRTMPGGEAGATLKAAMDVDKQTGSTWAEVMTDSGQPTTSTVGSNTMVAATTPKLTEGVLHRYRAWTRSYAGSVLRSGPSNASATGPGWCYFIVDATAPKAPTIKFNGPYTPCTTNDCAANGKPGVSGSFTFSPAAGDNIIGYRYRLSTDAYANPDWTYSTTGSAVAVMPPTSGTVTMTVEAQDAVGTKRWGADNIVDFAVSRGAAPVGHWSFDEKDGNALDSSATDTASKDDAALSGGGTRAGDGRRGELLIKPATETTEAEWANDTGLTLNGTTAYAATLKSVLDTRASYTLAAWVRLSAKGHTSTVLSQDGTHSASFDLAYCEDTKTWCMRLADTDTTTTSLNTQRVNALSPAAVGVWTQLAAVVDTTKNTVTLYVNGIPQGSDALGTSWDASGPVQIGRAKAKDAYTDYFPGVIDEASIWAEARGEQDVAKDAALRDKDTGDAYAELVAAWNPAGKTDTTLADSSGYHHDLTLTSGALDGEAISLNGTTAAGTTPGPLVDDSGSFTVTANAAVDSDLLADKPEGYKAQILGQRTATDSSWSLWFEKTKTTTEPVLDEFGDPVLDGDGNPITQPMQNGRWHFGRLTADGTGTEVESTEGALLDSPARLTGVYDAQAKTITLYLSSEPGEPKAYTAALGTGEFTVGKGYLKSVWGNYLPGRIDDVRLWAGALKDGDQVAAIVG
ncbi:LamG domain-containing protein [Streptomyces beijiangensis]